MTFTLWAMFINLEQLVRVLLVLFEAPTQLTSNVIAYGSNIYSGAVNFYYDVDDVITSLAMLNAKFSESLANLVNVS